MAMLELKDLLKTKVNLKLTKVKKAVYMTAFFLYAHFDYAQWAFDYAQWAFDYAHWAFNFAHWAEPKWA